MIFDRTINELQQFVYNREVMDLTMPQRRVNPSWSTDRAMSTNNDWGAGAPQDMAGIGAY